MKLGLGRDYQKGRAAIRHYATQPHATSQDSVCFVCYRWLSHRLTQINSNLYTGPDLTMH